MMNRSRASEHSHKTATLHLPPTAARYPQMVQNSFVSLDCERRDLNPHALRHWILSPARLPFRHSRVRLKLLQNRAVLKGVLIVFLGRNRDDLGSTWTARFGCVQGA
jgi:hypothetical protein